MSVLQNCCDAVMEKYIYTVIYIDIIEKKMYNIRKYREEKTK